ncbi:YEATS-associated helix-containing protein [Sphingomicrobium sediminis]|uniref:YEATS-Like-Associating Three TM domain-containing protein n=1 Tax=Sphingomicrobium sediminis TaxID=2950949 RepID=A0A9X2EIR0_9SPHN|nr:YEATS-associated helix-containing protein [Sphingomicrobium sediminis]MCM8557536.1 hypothetical protein [Sphingomicrobium sediminis]
MDKVLAVGTIIFAAAIIGSIAAWLMGQGSGDPMAMRRKKLHGLATYLMVGIVAAGSVPLLLSLVRSDLVSGIFNAEWSAIYENLVILFGLGLVAAYLSRFFIESSSRRVVEEMSRMEMELKDAQAKNRALAEYVDDRAAAPRKDAKGAAAKKTAEKARAAANDLSEHQQLFIKSLSSDDQKMLKAVTERDYRTAAGVAADLELPRFKVEEKLDDMAEAGLVKSSESPVTHGTRYAISPIGWAALAGEHKAEASTGSLV